MRVWHFDHTRVCVGEIVKRKKEIPFYGNLLTRFPIIETNLTLFTIKSI